MQTTVDEAIRKGQRMVNYPVLAIMIGTICISFLLGFSKTMPFWIVPAGFSMAFILSWLYWNVMITKWRLWAFENVRNVHELKKRAIREKLIWKDDGFFEKTEIRCAADEEKWDTLQDKFKQEDLFTDDLTVATETLIYYSKSKNFTEMALMLAAFIAGVYLLLATQSYIPGAMLTLVCGYLAFKNYK